MPPRSTPTCAACGKRADSRTVICTRCARRLGELAPMLGNGPPGLDRVWSSSPYRNVARNLVGALRCQQLLSVAELMAERIESLAPAHMLSGLIVPVPNPRPARREKTFDSSAANATA